MTMLSKKIYKKMETIVLKKNKIAIDKFVIFFATYGFFFVNSYETLEETVIESPEVNVIIISE